MARADPVGAGSSFLLVRQLVRAAAALRESAPAGEQERGASCVRRPSLPGAEAARIADFLGALVGLSAPERPSPEMRAAQSDPQMMALWLRARSRVDRRRVRGAPLLRGARGSALGRLPSVTYLARALATSPPSP